MNPETILAGTASLFLALGDKTRLRLLNLMRDREVCVSSFTGILEQSQPLVSRHLAYLRNSGIVEARRDGKWIHYSISTELDVNSSRLLFELFKWMESQDGLRADRDKYRLLMGESPVENEATRTKSRHTPRSTAVSTPPRQPTELDSEPQPNVERTSDFRMEVEAELEDGSSVEEDSYYQVRHNELEDFLL